VLGGGFPSTELRRLEDPRFFDCFDYLVLDDGEGPLRRICDRLEGADVPLHKTFTRERDAVVWHEQPDAATPRFRELPTPDYRGHRMDRYIHPISSGQNPFNRLLNDGPWLKLTAAHGCYWKKCTFCDIHLAYIDDFDPLSARELADQMDAVHEQTGLSSFHFTDEAAPPPLLVNLALELLRRDRCYQYWGNIRYDTGFTPDRCRLLAASGMIAVTGGIEIASDALLPKIEKGITVPQVTKVLQAMASAGILTHAYLIYGFPGETLQDTINSLETLRQLIRAGLLQSGFYHRFSLTAHSPVGRKPELFGIRVKGPKFGGFGSYNLDYESVTVPHPDDRVFTAIQTALAAFARGERLDTDVRSWFEGGAVPAPAVPPDFVEQTMKLPHPSLRPGSRLCWLGGVPRWSQGLLNVSCAGGDLYTTLAPRWVADHLSRCHPTGWTQPHPPEPADFSPAGWFEPLMSRGMVLV
jgi:Radical SAM superfamily